MLIYAQPFRGFSEVVLVSCMLSVGEMRKMCLLIVLKVLFDKWSQAASHHPLKAVLKRLQSRRAWRSQCVSLR